MSEYHFSSVQALIKGLEVGEQVSKFGRTVEISRGGSIKFLGFLVEKSIVIPLSYGKDSDDYLSQVSGANLEVVRSNSIEGAQPATCHLLGLPYNGPTLKLRSDGQWFGQISAIHLHPDEFIESQDHFIKFASDAFESVGATLTILE